MARYIKAPSIRNKSVVIYNTSDWHVGSKCFHESAAKEIIRLVKKDRAYLTFGGDAIEGKTIDSPHFNPDGLDSGKLNIQKQAEYFAQLLKPIRDRVLMVQMGNHELYMLRDFNVVDYICTCISRPDVYGDYQTWVRVSGVTLHFWHGRPTMPRGAKDPIQKEANQKAWLKNKLFPLAGSAQAQYMAHTHHCLVVKPIEQYSLLDHGKNVHGEYFIEQVRDVNGKVWVPPDARWYVNTGTLRRGGGFGHQDYSEIAGYTPPPIAATRTIIQGGRVVKIERIVF